MKSIEYCFSMNPARIAWLKFILDGYDGLAVLTTVDAGAGRVVLRIPPGSEADALQVLQSIRAEIGMKEEMTDP